MFCSSEVMPIQVVVLPASDGAREALRAEGLLQHGPQQVEAEEADAPQSDDAGEGQQHADDRVAPPARIGKEIGERAHLLLFGPGLEPRFGFLELLEDDQCEGRGRRAGQEHPAPRVRDDARLLHLAEHDAGHRRHHIAHRRKRLQHAERVGPRAIRHRLRHQRHAHGELPADAQAAQEAVDIEIPDAGGRTCSSPVNSE